MEFLTILLSSLLGLISPVGLLVDRISENTIRSQFAKVEQLQVRVDNAPTHQLLQGKVDRVRIAGRSLQLKRSHIRIAVFELETDRIELDTRTIGKKRTKFKQPLQAGLRLVLTEADVNKVLQSPEFLSSLGKLNIISANLTNKDSNPLYRFANPRVKFLTNQRVNLQVEIQEEGNGESVVVNLETGLNIVAGRKLQLVEPIAKVNEEQVPPRFLNAIVNNLNQRLDLRNLETDGLLMRIIKLEMKPGKLEIGTFIRIEPSSKFLETIRF
jgi:LmeA-like phospholipid-binding